MRGLGGAGMLRDVVHRVESGPYSGRTGAPLQSSRSHSDLKLGLLSFPLGQSRKLGQKGVHDSANRETGEA